MIFKPEKVHKCEREEWSPANEKHADNDSNCDGRLSEYTLRLWELVREKTRANTGHAVLQSTLKPPKMRGRNRPTDGRPDFLLEVLCST